MGIVIIFMLSLFGKVVYTFLYFKKPLVHLQDVKVYYIYIVGDVLLFILLRLITFVDKVYLW